MDKKIVVITGATASGKTKLAIKVAKKIKAQIICADSRIVYKDLDIVSAKPTIEEQEGVIHHLIDIMTPESEFCAGDFVCRAQDIIEKTDDNIIICGGTWFYIKSLLDEKTLPECPINHKLREELLPLPSSELWEKLNKLDPKRAQLIHPNNKDKVIRSIEMCIALNAPISEYKRKDNIKYNANWYMRDISREVLYDRINKRVDEMINLGLEEEWDNNRKKYKGSKIIENTIGYSEFFEYKDRTVAIDKIKQHTRNFAKRQLTYFKNNKDIKLINDIDDIMKDLEC